MRDLRDTSADVRGNMRTAIEHISGMRASVSRIPRLTGALIKAKKKTLIVTERLLSETANGISLLEQMEKTIDDILAAGE